VTIHCGTARGESVTKIGNHNFLMAYVHIAHDCTLGNHIIMANAISLAGHVEIQDYAFVGPLCAIHQFCRIGAYSFLGACTVATRDVLPYSKTSAPRPLGVYGTNRSRLEREGLSKEDIKELDAAFRLLSRSRLNTTQALEAMEARAFKSPHVRKLVEFISASPRGVAK
jgi:UDP-N-acetylglucosamine acyltransferase